MLLGSLFDSDVAATATIGYSDKTVRMPAYKSPTDCERIRVAAEKAFLRCGRTAAGHDQKVQAVRAEWV